MLLSKLAFFTAAASAYSASEVVLQTDNVDMLNMFNLTELLSGWEEVGLTLNGVVFGQEHLENMMAFNTTPTRVVSDMTPTHELDARAPTVACDTAECYTGGKYSFFTVQQELFISGKLCNGISKFSYPALAAGVGFFTGKAVCQNSATCELTAAVVFGGAAGVYTAPVDALVQECQATYNAIKSRCGTEGGATQCFAKVQDKNADAIFTLEATTLSNTCAAPNCNKVTCSTSNNYCQA